MITLNNRTTVLLFDERQFLQKADCFWHSMLGQTLYTFYYYTVLYPLQHIYYRGFWKALPPEDICARLTRTHADLWSRSPENQEQCVRVIERDFDSWVVWLEVGAYFVLVMSLALCITRRIFSWRSMKNKSFF